MFAVAIVTNRSGYSTRDLTAYLDRAFRALRVRRPIHVTIVPSPIFSRGCADVGHLRCSGDRCSVRGPRRMVLSIAAPSNASPVEFRRRLYCLVRHETWHVQGYDHEAMPERILYSEGPAPCWAMHAKLAWAGPPRRPRPLLVGGSYR